MKKICAVVLNSVSYDARVLREAASLASAGNESYIVGIKDANLQCKEEIYNDNVVIKRVSLSVPGVQIKKLRNALIFFVLSILILLVVLYPPDIATIGIIIAFIAIAIAIRNIIQFYRQIKFVLDSDTEDKKLEQPVTSNFSLYSVFQYFSFRTIISKIFELIDYAIWFYIRLLPLYKEIRKIAPDIIHCHDVYTLPIGGMMKYKHKSKIVYDAHEIYEELAQAKLRLIKLCWLTHIMSCGFIDSFITINASIAKWYSKNYPRMPKPVIIKNAPLYANKLDYDDRLHRAAGIEKHKRILLYQGGYSRHRGLENLVLSAKYFPEDWVLVMMGWGALEEDLRNIVDTTESADMTGDKKVYFLPRVPQEELSKWTAGATIGIIPYENIGLNHWFCTPNKLWEYPNAGVPIIVSPFPELLEPVEEYEIGWPLPIEIGERSIGELLSTLNESDIKDAKKNTRRYMEENHWGVYEEKLLGLYERLSS